MRNRLVALVTRDPVLYAELAATLKERRWKSISLLPGQRIPETVAIVLTSPAEEASIRHPRVVAVLSDGDHRALWAAVESAFDSSATEAEVVIGIDPGPRPGYAVVRGNATVARGSLETPEGVADLVTHIRRRFPSPHLRVRVGSGDPPFRNRILTALLSLRRPVEVVDESGTTPRSYGRRPKDSLAAEAIARSQGRPLHDRPLATITPGDIANLQRVSRISSGGRFTIPKSMAQRVLAGELTLNEALSEGERLYRSPNRTGAPSIRSREPS